MIHGCASAGGHSASPFLLLDLEAQLKAALDSNNAELAVAKTGDQPHPVFSLCRSSVQFADETAFRNINTREELTASGKG